jgi:transcriptional regulator with XRE-family HTH domain
MDVDMRELGRRAREAREAAGISQDTARKAIDVSQPTYSRIENGDRPLKGDELVQLDSYLTSQGIAGAERQREPGSAMVPRAPLALMARAVEGYQRGVLGINELASWYGREPAELEAELGPLQSPDEIDEWDDDAPLVPDSELEDTAS